MESILNIKDKLILCRTLLVIVGRRCPNISPLNTLRVCYRKQINREGKMNSSNNNIYNSKYYLNVFKIVLAEIGSD